ncbi:hypothetical protein GCM10018775_92280 [Streptomyces umbrinus]|nr:hypothetical protein GCM10018775_92280 [Streptomyces umbrinus]
MFEPGVHGCLRVLLDSGAAPVTPGDGTQLLLDPGVGARAAAGTGSSTGVRCAARTLGLRSSWGQRPGPDERRPKILHG